MSKAVMLFTPLDKALFDFYNTRFALLNAIPIMAVRTAGIVFAAPFATIQKPTALRTALCFRIYPIGTPNLDSMRCNVAMAAGHI
jgi:hypothetical protein